MNEAREILNSIKMYLETDRLAGITDIISKSRDVAFSGNEIRTDKILALDDLRKKAGECTGCQLFKRRTNLVFGSGDPGAKLMFVGEAPGADEDLKGLPFVGRAGELLTKMIEAMGVKREDVYIANILKCRPPGNRVPMPEEIAACTHFLEEQIKTIKPKVICALGKFASQFLLKSQEPISMLRGKFRQLGDTKIMPTYHPAYLLRNPADKRLVWEDLKKVRDELK